MSNLFTQSGVKYLGKKAPANLQGQAMEDEINPFAILDEAHLLRRTISGRLVDTFNIIVGNHFDLEYKGYGRKGVLDIFIFPLISRILCYHIANNEISPARRLGAACIGIPLQIIRLATAASLTVAVSPLVLLVHLAIHAFYLPQESLLKKSVLRSNYGVTNEKEQSNFVPTPGI